MTLDFVRRRLHAQCIAGSRLRSPEAVVSWMGAMQAQEFGPAKWGIGLRAPGLTEAEIDEAFNAGRVLRTHVLRPTWHFVVAADIRWMLAVSGPRVHAANRHYYKKTGVDSALLIRSRRLIERSLAGGNALTRTELAAVLARAGAHAQGQQLAYLMMHAELDGVVCSGPRRGKQFTYMLLEERVPRAQKVDVDEALGELARRYFTSRGPATMRDFSWWSGMTIRETRRALDIVKPVMVGESASGEQYWCCASGSVAPPSRPRGTVDLLPVYDEYLIAYKDRQLVASRAPQREDRHHDPYAHFLMLDGRLAGTWRRSDRGETIRVMTSPYRPFTKAHQQALAAAVSRFAAFVGRRSTISVEESR